METTRKQIERFLRENHEYFSGLGAALKAESIEADPESDEWLGMDLTVATDDGWNEWSYQTGDNSYTGGCYFFHHWAVVTYYGDETADDMVASVLDQLGELTADVSATIPGFNVA